METLHFLSVWGSGGYILAFVADWYVNGLLGGRRAREWSPWWQMGTWTVSSVADWYVNGLLSGRQAHERSPWWQTGIVTVSLVVDGYMNGLLGLCHCVVPSSRDSGLSHVTWFYQRDISKYDTNRGLINICAVGLPSWNPDTTWRGSPR